MSILFRPHQEYWRTKPRSKTLKCLTTYVTLFVMSSMVRTVLSCYEGYIWANILGGAAGYRPRVQSTLTRLHRLNLYLYYTKFWIKCKPLIWYLSINSFKVLIHSKKFACSKFSTKRIKFTRHNRSF